MKKIYLAGLFALVLFAGCAGDAGLDLPEGATEDGTYRLVTLAGAVEIVHNPDDLATVLDSGEGMKVCTGSGQYSVQLLFSLDGGEPIDQKSTIALTGYNCLNYGTATACDYELAAEDYEPRSFEVAAYLGPDEGENYNQTFGDFEGFSDQLAFAIPQVVMMDPVSVTWACSGPAATMPDYGIYMHLLTPFYADENGDMIQMYVGLDEPQEGSFDPEQVVDPIGDFTAYSDYVVTEVLVFEDSL
ncbi:MAG: hypothetical protein ACD_65C00129G0002 [uncultured bacterium]|nr:MAG: hypothetical protein ACD_65C00129G0002 [uncultured bacterium]KKT01895.1 MAG: hypothetical protein UV80_C0007G0009 [Candidatus Peregrinibacteria bacterium GW2011_GWF2_43_17]HAU39550.1 hypothetical protein [Candidatus Peregrinibacteria bacterium]